MAGGLIPPSTFDKARRKKTRRRLVETFGGEDTQELLPLKEVTSRLRMFNQHYVGIRTIPVEKVIGTTDRSIDFDRQFLPRRRDMAERWRRVEMAFPEGDFPPITVYEVNGYYFLVDGHHRVAIARQRGIEFIDAEVTQLTTRYPLPADADIGRIIHTEQKQIFMEESGLDRARPEAEIEFSRPAGYPELLELVKAHGFDLSREGSTSLDAEEVAGFWYDHFYLPAVDAIRGQHLYDAVPNTTDADLYLKVYQFRRAISPERGGMDFAEAVRLVKENELEHTRRKIRRRALALARERVETEPNGE
jgi:hypothetical protein